MCIIYKVNTVYRKTTQIPYTGVKKTQWEKTPVYGTTTTTRRINEMQNIEKN